MQGETPPIYSVWQMVFMYCIVKQEKTNKQTNFKRNKPKLERSLSLWFTVIYSSCFYSQSCKYDSCDVMTWPRYCTAQCYRSFYFLVVPNHYLLSEILSIISCTTPKRARTSTKQHDFFIFEAQRVSDFSLAFWKSLVHSAGECNFHVNIVSASVIYA